MEPSRVKALIDTNILIDYLQSSQDASSELNRYDELFISRITWIEFLVGAKTPEDASLRKSLLRLFSMLELDQSIAEHSITIRQHSRMELPDAIILATARAHGLLLVTRNHRDFPRREPDVRIPY
jgi:predicted nucleic acid-binding protein